MAFLLEVEKQKKKKGRKEKRSVKEERKDQRVKGKELKKRGEKRKLFFSLIFLSFFLALEVGERFNFVFL